METDHWWKNTTIYQVYPRSFFDSNADGIGDLLGIISKLDYIKDLGFGTIWFSPFFDSPQQDFGYDVKDYYQPSPEYGQLSDILELISEIHARGMRVIFDLVLNHTSDQHPWFLESRSSRDNPKRDWYIWRDGKSSRPPNNWKAIPGGSGWHYDQVTDQWYYASFLPFQPDLNFRNPDVKEAMLNVIRFWLEKGIDGFRLDIFHSVFKDCQFLDNPFSIHYIPYQDKAGFFQQWKFTVNQSETISFARELRKLVDTYKPDRFLLGEIFADDEIKKRYLGENQEGLNLVFLWDLPDSKITAANLKKVIKKYESNFPDPYLPVYVLGNHDRKRVLSRAGGNENLAILLAVLIFTARGVPVTYYGEEIGMVEAQLPIKTCLDPVGQRYKNLPRLLIDALNLYVNRDGCRTPMQWNSEKNAGFSTSEKPLWLQLSSNFSENNVEKLSNISNSILNIYKSLLILRKNTPALLEGRLKLLETTENILAYERILDEERIRVYLNFANFGETFSLVNGIDKIVFSTSQVMVNEGKLEIPPYGAVIVRYKE